MEQTPFVQATRRWLEDVVIDLNLCPFARRELVNNRIRFALSQAETPETLLKDLQQELLRLTDDTSIETTLLIHPHVLQDFLDYNEFLAAADGLIGLLELDGELQIASFHPDYQFDGTDADAVENTTNRSPYPMLHLLREASLEKAIDRYPDTSEIPRTNIQRVEALGKAHMDALLQRCLTDPSNKVG